MVEYKEHHKSVLMFNCVKKTAHQNIYAIFFIQVQIIQIIPRSFENGNFLVQRPNSSFMTKTVNETFFSYST